MIFRFVEGQLFTNFLKLGFNLLITPQNGQTHSNNSSANAHELFECAWRIWKGYIFWKVSGKLSSALVSIRYTQRQSLADVLWKTSPEKLRQIHRKSPVFEPVIWWSCRHLECNFSKKKFRHRCFFTEFYEIFPNNSFTEHFWMTASVNCIHL